MALFAKITPKTSTFAPRLHQKIYQIKKRHSIKSALSLKFFEYIVNLEEVCVVVVAVNFVEVLIPAMVEISVAGRTKQATMFKAGGISVANQENMV